MKKLLLTGLAIAGLSLTTLNSRADGISFSISLGHDHHYHAPPVVVAPRPVFVHPAHVCEVIRPPVHVYGHRHFERSHYTHRDYRHDKGHVNHGYGSYAKWQDYGHSSHRSHGQSERGRHGHAH